MLMVCTSVAADADGSGARPGDETLSCDQIYAEGMAIVKTEQEQRDAMRSRMGTQAKGTAALIVAASTVGQVDPTHATGVAAKAAVQAEVKSQTELGTQAGKARPDVRKEHLRALWAQKHCTKN